MKVKCYGQACLDKNLKHEKETLIEDGGKRYCKSCLESKKIEIQERNELYALIKSLYNIPYPNGMMLKQIKNFKEEFSYTYEGMRKTLLYLSKKSNVSFSIKYGLGIISYKYDEANLFYKEQEERMLKAAFTQEIKSDEKVVVTKRPNNINAIKKERMIDLNSLI